MVIAELDAGRGFLWLPVALGTGIATYFALTFEPSLIVLVGFLLAAGGATAIWRHHFAVRLALVALTVFCAGLALAKVRTELVSAPRLERQLTLTVKGWVERIEDAPTVGRRVLIRVAALEDTSRPAPHRVRITLRKGGDDLMTGDAISARARLTPPSGPVYPGGYDVARAAYYQRIGAYGFALGAPEAASLDPPPWSIRLGRPVARLREAIRLRVEAALPGDNGEIAAALITGDRGGISADTVEAMRASGLGHVLAISGLHMALVAGTAFWLIRALLALSPALALSYSIKKWAAAGALGVAAFYLLISSAAIATQRAFLMMAIMLIAILVDRRAITLRNVALAALAILILAPESLFTASFQMSFAATVALVSAYEAFNRWRQARPAISGAPTLLKRMGRNIGGLAFTSVVAGLATAPFALYHFQRVAVLTLIANLAAMPAVGAVIMPAALIAVLVMPLGLEVWPLALMGVGLDWVTMIAKAVTSLSGDVGLVRAAPPAALAVFAIGFLWLVLWRGWLRLAGIAPMLVAAALSGAQPQPDLVVDEDATAVAVRGADGRFTVLRRGRASYEVGRWLQMDGDSRSVTDKTLTAAARCDDIGCTALVPGDGPLVAFSLNDLSLEEDCRLADVMIARGGAPSACPNPELIIDRAALARFGAHAVYDLAGEGTPAVRTAYPLQRRPFMPPVDRRYAQ